MKYRLVGKSGLRVSEAALGTMTFGDEWGLFTLSRLTESAATALHNASLLAAEPKVEVLETLVTVSHEITSTLNL